MEAMSALSQSCIAHAFDILQRARCCCWPHGVIALVLQGKAGNLHSSAEATLPHLRFLLLSLTNICCFRKPHIGCCPSRVGVGEESCSLRHRSTGSWDPAALWIGLGLSPPAEQGEAVCVVPRHGACGASRSNS